MNVITSKEPTKICSKCLKRKPASSFGIRKVSPDGLNGRCKSCIQLIVDDWKIANPVRYLCSTMLTNAKRRAKAKNRTCTIDYEHVLSLYSDKCPVLGLKLRWSYKQTDKRGSVAPNSPTLDRINNDDGYVPGNVVIISHKANLIKNDLSLQELQQIVQWLANVSR